jgi:hypothetical protein
MIQGAIMVDPRHRRDHPDQVQPRRERQPAGRPGGALGEMAHARRDRERAARASGEITLPCRRGGGAPGCEGGGG